jgi:hypothetical protein
VPIPADDVNANYPLLANGNDEAVANGRKVDCHFWKGFLMGALFGE